MVSRTRSKAVLELGSRLVSQLGASDDLLASWMAHYIAELLEAVERAPANAKASAQEACAKAILELWRHRAGAPKHLRPLVQLEPLLRTLASLDVERTDYRYYPQALREVAIADADEATRKWIELAIGVDYSARLLIQGALRSATTHAASLAEPWIELAQLAGENEDIERLLVEFAREGRAVGKTAKSARTAVLNGRLSRLESFVALATSLIEDLQAQLATEKVGKKQVLRKRAALPSAHGRVPRRRSRKR